MGHQLLLTSSIPHSKYTQTISTLEALTGLRRPQIISTYNILTKPHNVFKPVFEPGKVNQIEQYYMKCSTTWHDEASKNLDLKTFFTASDVINVDRLFAGKEVKHWTLSISDIPNAGKNPVSAQNFYESTIVHHHSRKEVPLGVETEISATTEVKQEGVDNTEVKTDVGNTQVKTEAKETFPNTQLKEQSLDTTLWDSVSEKEPGIHGFEASDPIEIDTDLPDLNNNNDLLQSNTQDAMQIDLPEETKAEEGKAEETKAEAKTTVPKSKDSFLQFIEDLGYGVVNQYWLKGVRFFHGDVVIEIFKIFVTDDAAEAQETKIKLQVLDLSNTFQVRAYISYPKGSSVDSISKGTKTLTDLKAKLHNLFELDVPDRMAMDSRVPRY